MRLSIVSLLLMFLAFDRANGLGKFLMYLNSSCIEGYEYEPAEYVLQRPDWWLNNCLFIEGTLEYFAISFNQSFAPSSLSASFRMQLWTPSLGCGFAFSVTESDIFEVTSPDWPGITCQQGQFTRITSAGRASATVWYTIEADPNTQPSSTAIPPRPADSSTGSSSSSSSSSWSSSSSSSGDPFPFDSSIFNPTGPIDPVTTADGNGVESHQDAMIAGVVSGGVIVLLLIAIGVYYFLKRRRSSHEQLPSYQDRASLQESLYSRNAGYSEY